MTECIEWRKSCGSHGYGQVKRHGKLLLAHRVAYEEFRGPIPPGLHVLHHCDNPACVNPDHLFLGTPADNAADMVRKGRHRSPKGKRHGLYLHPQCRARGERSGNAKLTEEKVLEIRGDGRSQRVIAKEYGVSHQTIGEIKRREIWAHIP